MLVNNPPEWKPLEASNTVIEEVKKEPTHYIALGCQGYENPYTNRHYINYDDHEAGTYRFMSTIPHSKVDSIIIVNAKTGVWDCIYPQDVTRILLAGDAVVFNWTGWM